MTEEITIELLNQQLQEVLQEESEIYPLEFTDDSGKQGLIILNHYLNKDSMDSVKILTNKQRALDVGIIGRSIFESVLNMGLIWYLPVNEGVTRYELFMSVESKKVYEHMADIEKDTASKIYKSEDIKRWEAESAQYERDYGRATSSWSGKGAVEICKILDREYPPVIKSEHFFEFMYCQSYRYGSSATHRSQRGISRHLEVVSAPSRSGGTVHSAQIKEEGLVFNYFHSLIAFLASMRVIGRAFNIPSLEDYFQRKVGLLIAGYPEVAA